MKKTQKSITSFFAPKKKAAAPDTASTRALAQEKENVSEIVTIIDDDEKMRVDDNGDGEEEDCFPMLQKRATPSNPNRNALSNATPSFSSNRKKRVIIDDDDDDDEEDGNSTAIKVTPSKKLFTSPNPLLKTATTPMSQRLAQFINSPGFMSSPNSNASTFNSSPSSSSQLRSTPNRSTKMDEERYSWLINLKDCQGNVFGSPDYDPRTLLIPSSAWKTFTPFEKQFWEIKSKHFDTVVFFKKGKFYELYEQDADIGMREFDLKMTDRQVVYDDDEWISIIMKTPLSSL